MAYPVQSYNKKQLCAIYKVGRKILECWIEPVATEVGWQKGQQTFTPKQVKAIFEFLGQPDD